MDFLTKLASVVVHSNLSINKSINIYQVFLNVPFEIHQHLLGSLDDLTCG